MSRVALITGCTGQDGSFLTELLLGKGYTVHGIIRRSSLFNTGRIDHLKETPNLILHYGDMTDGQGLFKIVADVMPDEIYNLAAQSHVKVSFDQPLHAADVDALGTLRLLEAVRSLQKDKQIKFFQASSSEMFGSSPPPQNEWTPFKPNTPSGCAKLFSYWQVKNYRDAYGLHASNGIMFNHESERRGETFVTRKITRAVTRIKYELQQELRLGNLEACRDWGYAGDYVEAMWLMLQQDYPEDYVVATGEQHSVSEFLELAFGEAGLDWRKYVITDEHYKRPNDTNNLRGNAARAHDILNWFPKVAFPDLVKRMVQADEVLASKEVLLRWHRARE